MKVLDVVTRKDEDATEDERHCEKNGADLV